MLRYASLINGSALTLNLKSHKSQIYIKPRGSIAIGFMIFLFGFFLVTPVASWLLNTFGWISMLTGGVIFFAGILSAVRSRV